MQDKNSDRFLLEDPDHRAWLWSDALRQLQFFQASLNPKGGFHVLDHSGSPLESTEQELHTTTRLVHSYALGKQIGFENSETIVDHGME